MIITYMIVLRGIAKIVQDWHGKPHHGLTASAHDRVENLHSKCSTERPEDEQFCWLRVREHIIVFLAHDPLQKQMLKIVDQYLLQLRKREAGRAGRHINKKIYQRKLKRLYEKRVD